MKILISSWLSFIFLLLAVLHIYWGFGGKRLSAAIIPTNKNNQPVLKPGVFDCLVVAVGLLGFGTFVLIKSGFVTFGLPGWFLNYGFWVIGGLFLLRAIGEFKYVGVFKKIKDTRFGQMDSKYYSPLCLLIGLLCITLELMA